VTVARPWHYKGVDMLVDAWPAVRAAVPDAELHVVGRGHPDAYAETPGVRVRGYVDRLADAFSPASLFVQPSRVDAFPVSTLEAMRAGVPPLVTRTTGTRSEAREIDEALVVETSVDGLRDGIRRYFGRDADERRAFARRARERGARFDAESRTAAFREAFRDVLKAL
jgi:glycosyltransferase involved in cell wall biosynthesis